MINKVFAVRALSPVHCGIGQIVNDIDLPTARNKVTGHPLIPGSSLKGVLKDEFLNNGLGGKNGNEDWKIDVESLFGSDESTDFASAISLGDANLLALPVRSFFGTFAYLASPYTLNLLKNNLTRAGITENLPSIPTRGVIADNGSYKAIVTQESLLTRPKYKSILLEEIDLLLDEERSHAQEWADIIAPLFFQDGEGQEIFKKRFAIVDDNALNFFCDTALPVDARIAINDKTGTVKQGALWYEETIPAETLLMGVVGIDHSFNSQKPSTDTELADVLTQPGTIYCQVGGKATTGKGFVAVNIQSGRA